MATRLTFHGGAGTVTGSCYRVVHRPRPVPGRLRHVPGQQDGARPQLQATSLRAQGHRLPAADPRPHRSRRPPAQALQAWLSAGRFMPPRRPRACSSSAPRQRPHPGERGRAANRRNRRRGRRAGRAALYARKTPRSAEADPGGRLRAMDRARSRRARTLLECRPHPRLGLDRGAKSRTATARLRILFSGDLGPDEKVFYLDPDAPAGFDYILCESTYGGREREDYTVEQRRRALHDEINDALARGGNLVIPAFAVERSQELLHDIGVLIRNGEIRPSRSSSIARSRARYAAFTEVCRDVRRHRARRRRAVQRPALPHRRERRREQGDQLDPRRRHHHVGLRHGRCRPHQAPSDATT